jgi:hypothetical protein
MLSLNGQTQERGQDIISTTGQFGTKTAIKIAENPRKERE